MQKQYNKCQPTSKNGKIFSGIIVVAIGVVFLLKQLQVQMPEWLFTWPMILIAVGFFSGAKRGFKTFGWLIPVAIGVGFLIQKHFLEINVMHFFWPILIIIVGLFIIFKPKINPENYITPINSLDGDLVNEDKIEAVSIFGGVRKNVISKNFKGGEITCIMGGADINLMQAEINGKAYLETTNIFGGTKLIIPSNWEVIIEASAILGGIDDKRPLQTIEKPIANTLVIRGTTIFGGIEIKGY